MIDDRPGSLLQPHLSSEPHSNFPSDQFYRSLEIPPFFFISWLPQKSHGVTQDRLAWKRRKKAFPFSRRHFPLAFVHSANNPSRSLISSLLLFPCSIFWAGRRRKLLEPPCLTSFVIEQRASEQAIIGVLFLFCSGAGALYSHFPFSKVASESIFFQNYLCISIGSPEFFLDSLICLAVGL